MSDAIARVGHRLEEWLDEPLVQLDFDARDDARRYPEVYLDPVPAARPMLRAMPTRGWAWRSRHRTAQRGIRRARVALEALVLGKNWRDPMGHVQHSEVVLDNRTR